MLALSWIAGAALPCELVAGNARAEALLDACATLAHLTLAAGGLALTGYARHALRWIAALCSARLLVRRALALAAVVWIGGLLRRAAYGALALASVGVRNLRGVTAYRALALTRLCV